jgi:hypothetical protein
MSWLILFFIRLYWRLIPEVSRKQCIFKESCSRYVYRIISDEGFIPGLQAFVERWKKCKPGYIIKNSNDGKNIELLLKDGTVLEKKDIADSIIEPWRQSIKYIEDKYCGRRSL